MNNRLRDARLGVFVHFLPADAAGLASGGGSGSGESWPEAAS